MQADTSFWLTKNNDYGTAKKTEAKQIFNDLERLCEYRSRSDTIIDRHASYASGALAVVAPTEEQRLREDFILHDIEPIQPDLENQKLLSDFKLAAAAMFFIK